MPEETHKERLDRLDKAVQVIEDKQVIIENNHKALQQLVADLATQTRLGFERFLEMLAKQSQEADRRKREADERMNRTDERMNERFKETDERIDKLVIAIGELIRSQKAS